jgi:hypothetical protein
MPIEFQTKEEILQALVAVAAKLGRPPSRSEFRRETGVSEYTILKHFLSWNDAVAQSGLSPHSLNKRVEDEELLADWGEMVRRHRSIPTRAHYRREGRYSPGAMESHFGPWSSIPDRFRSFAEGNPDWAEVLPFIPETVVARTSNPANLPSRTASDTSLNHSKLSDRPVYGNPLDFRGLRHQPVNEQGVVFLFGMVARELGYLVEAVQSGFPDCEAKRQIGPGKWQRVRIEFEFESRNFLEHGHQIQGCDVIVCWRDNWPDCPLEVLSLSAVIKNLGSIDE